MHATPGRADYILRLRTDAPIRLLSRLVILASATRSGCTPRHQALRSSLSASGWSRPPRYATSGRLRHALCYPDPLPSAADAMVCGASDLGSCVLLHASPIGPAGAGLGHDRLPVLLRHGLLDPDRVLHAPVSGRRRRSCSLPSSRSRRQPTRPWQVPVPCGHLILCRQHAALLVPRLPPQVAHGRASARLPAHLCRPADLLLLDTLQAYPGEVRPAHTRARTSLAPAAWQGRGWFITPV